MSGHELLTLVVALEERRLALPAAAVEGIHPVVELTALPDSPSCIEGLVNIHGVVVPVLDVRAALDLERRAPALSDRLVVVHVGGRPVALRVDRAVDLVEIADADLNRRETVPGADRLVGVAALPDGLLLVHDPDAFLSLQEVAQLDDALSGVEA